jgi:suppressor of G2 allele of SKP1
MSDPDPKLVSDAMEAFVDEDYDEARKLYTTLIEQSPEHVAAHVHRSAVNLKLDRFEDALSDAMKALSLDHENPKAYLRKGMALYELERYDPARAAFTIGQTLDPKHAAFKTWIARCEERILEERLADAKQREGPDATIKDATRAPRYKHQWYQSGSHVTIEIMAKGASLQQRFSPVPRCQHFIASPFN